MVMQNLETTNLSFHLQINTDRFNTMLPKLCVLARATPLDKYILVKGIMESHVNRAGEIVAVTGSGANDGPVLRMADVGFTMVRVPGIFLFYLLYITDYFY